MKEIKGNIWDYLADDAWVVVPTNGFVKRDGSCVMGRGVALEACRKFPTLATELGTRIKRDGNQVYVFHGYRIIAFPVKHAWWQKADLGLIEKSADRLFEEVGDELVYLPRVGCGNGQLQWSDVKPILEEVFHDQPNFIVVDKLVEVE